MSNSREAFAFLHVGSSCTDSWIFGYLGNTRVPLLLALNGGFSQGNFTKCTEFFVISLMLRAGVHQVNRARKMCSAFRQRPVPPTSVLLIPPTWTRLPFVFFVPSDVERLLTHCA